MLNRYLLPSYLMGAAMVMVSSPTYAADVITPMEISNIAHSTVVLIQPEVNAGGYGSGVIIGRYQENGNNVYIVLTAAHVVKDIDNIYTIYSPQLQSGGSRTQIPVSDTKNDIQKLPNVDLAIVKFRSNEDFQIATLGNSIYTKQGALIYVAGFPKPGAAIKKRLFQLTSSIVSTRADYDDVDSDSGHKSNKDESEGYAIGYTNVTRGGMSGGPIFDETGRVVGIHGKGDRDDLQDNLPSNGKPSEVGKQSSQENGKSTGSIGESTGFNWGIPIQTFLKLVPPDAISKMGIKYDDSEPGAGTNITLRGDNSKSALSPNIQRVNFTEEEDPKKDIIVKKSNSNPPSNTVVPQNSPPPQQPTTPINNTPNSNTSPSPQNGFF